MTLKVCAIVQARTGSSRLPNKVILDLAGRPLILFLIERLKRSRFLDEIILATTNKKRDNKLAKLFQNVGLKVVRGSEEDVLSRFFDAVNSSDSDIFLRITGDCPFVDPEIIDQVIETFINNDVDYGSNIDPPSFPDGLDVEIFSKEALIIANKDCIDKKDREHVTPYLRESGFFRTINIMNQNDLSQLRWTVDEKEDMELVRSIVKYFEGNSDFYWKDILPLYDAYPNMFKINEKFKRNEGENMSKWTKIFRRFKSAIFR